MFLLAVDTAGIQPYVFRASALQQVVGASALVARATGRWALDALPAPHNVADAASGQLNDTLRMEEAGLAAEVIFAAGGNVLVLFREGGDAEHYVTALRRRAAREAPGLSIVHATVPVAGLGTGGLHRAVNDVHTALYDRKARFVPDPQPLAPPAVATCDSTGLAAEGFIHRGRPHNQRRRQDDAPASAETLAKLAAFDQADRRLTDLVPPPRHDAYNVAFHYPRRFEDLGRSFGEDSLLGVVHADGNGLGKRLAGVTPELASTENPDRALIQALRLFSNAVIAVSQEAQRAVVARIVQSLSVTALDDRGRPSGLALGTRGAGTEPSVHLRSVEDHAATYYLPLRPLVFGGDDLTLACDGRLALSVALAYCEAFEAASEPHKEVLGGSPLTASAGVSIVPLGSPFARAYDLAEELTRSAKEHRTAAGVSGGALDWHIGAASSLDHARRVGYTVITRTARGGGRKGTLHLRPVILDDSAPPSFRRARWCVVREALECFRKTPWESHISDVQKALRSGPEFVKDLTAKHEPLPVLDVPQSKERAKDGWDGNTCLYYDAAELADLALDLASS